jgi:hypothetical protein
MAKPPKNYPLGGHDWVPTDPIRKLAVANEAQLAERYAEDVRAFRQAFFGKLAVHGAIAHTKYYGWAIFNDHTPGSIATEGSRAVVLACRMHRPKVPNHASMWIPAIRIVTNELVVHEETHACLTEDVSVDPNNSARYLIDAMDMAVSDEDSTLEVTSETLKKSLSPIFFASHDNRLHMSANTKDVIPTIRILDTTHKSKVHAWETAVVPFGYPAVLEDRLYALGRAKEILASVMNLEPLIAYVPGQRQAD